MSRILKVEITYQGPGGPITASVTVEVAPSEFLEDAVDRGIAEAKTHILKEQTYVGK